MVTHKAHRRVFYEPVHRYGYVFTVAADGGFCIPVVIGFDGPPRKLTQSGVTMAVNDRDLALC